MSICNRLVGLANARISTGYYAQKSPQSLPQRGHKICFEEVSILYTRNMGVDDTSQMTRDMRYVRVIRFNFHVLQLLPIR